MKRPVGVPNLIMTFVESCSSMGFTGFYMRSGMMTMSLERTP